MLARKCFTTKRARCFVPIVCLLVVAASNGVAERNKQSLPGEGELTEHFRRMTIYHERMDGHVPEGAVLFIGDSITQGLCVAAVCDRGVNYGIGSDTTAGVLERLPLYRSVERVSAVVLAIGINDLRRRDDEFILENMRAILEMLSAQTPVVVSAILPLDERVDSVGADRNARIAGLNKSILVLCDSFSSCLFVNAFPLLLDKEGNLAARYHVGDGVHPNTAGYEVWIKALQTGLQAAKHEGGESTNP